MRERYEERCRNAEDIDDLANSAALLNARMGLMPRRVSFNIIILSKDIRVVCTNCEL